MASVLATTTSNGNAISGWKQSTIRGQGGEVVVEEERILTFHERDVLLGKGSLTSNHPGNQKYLQMIKEYEPKYLQLNTKNEKTKFAMQIVQQCREQGIRFLKQTTTNDKEVTNNSNASSSFSFYWYDVGDIQARKKTSQALRETKRTKSTFAILSEQEDCVINKKKEIDSGDNSCNSNRNCTPSVVCPCESSPSSNNSNKIITNFTDKDILFGRGSISSNHPGNHKFLQMIKENELKYIQLKTKNEKTMFAQNLVDQLRSQGIRFLKKNEILGKGAGEKKEFWYDVGDIQARRKTSQALREKAPKNKNKVGITKEDEKVEDETKGITRSFRVTKTKTIKATTPNPSNSTSTADKKYQVSSSSKFSISSASSSVRSTKTRKRRMEQEQLKIVDRDSQLNMTQQPGSYEQKQDMVEVLSTANYPRKRRIVVDSSNNNSKKVVKQCHRYQKRNCYYYGVPVEGNGNQNKLIIPRPASTPSSSSCFATAAAATTAGVFYSETKYSCDKKDNTIQKIKPKWENSSNSTVDAERHNNNAFDNHLHDNDVKNRKQNPSPFISSGIETDPGDESNAIADTISIAAPTLAAAVGTTATANNTDEVYWEEATAMDQSSSSPSSSAASSTSSSSPTSAQSSSVVSPKIDEGGSEDFGMLPIATPIIDAKVEHRIFDAEIISSTASMVEINNDNQSEGDMNCSNSSSTNNSTNTEVNEENKEIIDLKQPTFPKSATATAHAQAFNKKKVHNNLKLSFAKPTYSDNRSVSSSCSRIGNGTLYSTTAASPAPAIPLKKNINSENIMIDAAAVTTASTRTTSNRANAMIRDDTKKKAHDFVGALPMHNKFLTTTKRSSDNLTSIHSTVISSNFSGEIHRGSTIPSSTIFPSHQQQQHNDGQQQKQQQKGQPSKTNYYVAQNIDGAIVRPSSTPIGSAIASGSFHGKDTNHQVNTMSNNEDNNNSDTDSLLSSSSSSSSSPLSPSTSLCTEVKRSNSQKVDPRESSNYKEVKAEFVEQKPQKTLFQEEKTLQDSRLLEAKIMHNNNYASNQFCEDENYFFNSISSTSSNFDTINDELEALLIIDSHSPLPIADETDIKNDGSEMDLFLLSEQRYSLQQECLGHDSEKEKKKMSLKQWKEDNAEENGLLVLEEQQLIKLANRSRESKTYNTNIEQDDDDVITAGQQGDRIMDNNEDTTKIFSAATTTIDLGPLPSANVAMNAPSLLCDSFLKSDGVCCTSCWLCCLCKNV